MSIKEHQNYICVDIFVRKNTIVFAVLMSVNFHSASRIGKGSHFLTPFLLRPLWVKYIRNYTTNKFGSPIH